MIKYEFDTLVLDATHTKQDQQAIDSFVASALDRERQRILSALEDSYADQGTLSIAKFKLREIISGKAY
jgi:hypothetical protein